MIRTRNFQPEKVAAHRHSIGGTVSFLAPLGAIVVPHATQANVLSLATGRAGFFLRRAVVSAADFKTEVEQNELYPDRAGFEMPTKINGHAQAEDYSGVWVEGEALLDASLADVAVGTRVTSAAGKFAALTNSTTQESLGVIRRKLPAANAESGFRYMIHVIRDTAAIVPA